MKANCETLSPKFKNLTVKKQYDAEESDDNLIITNDAGIKAKYNKKYFSIVPVVPPSILDSATIGVYVYLDNEEINVIVEHLGRGVAAINITMRTKRASNSCGIIEVNELSLLKGECDRVCPISATSMELFKRIITQIVNGLKEYHGAFITFSTNVDTETLAYYNEVLLEHHCAGGAFVRRNTNSGNMIALWVIPMNDERLTQ
jgi:hypothetical protein